MTDELVHFEEEPHKAIRMLVLDKPISRTV
jgi:hypothetical protein